LLHPMKLVEPEPLSLDCHPPDLANVLLGRQLASGAVADEELAFAEGGLRLAVLLVGAVRGEDGCSVGMGSNLDEDNQGIADLVPPDAEPDGRGEVAAELVAQRGLVEEARFRLIEEVLHLAVIVGADDERAAAGGESTYLGGELDDVAPVRQV